MLTFGGTFPGPTIVRRAGQDTRVTFVNHLPREDGAVTIHQHGGHQRSKFDGQPDSHLIRHGQKLTYDYPLRDGGSRCRQRCASTTTTAWTRPRGTTGSACRACS